MTTSGIYTFAPDFSEIATECWEDIGKARDAMPGDLLRSARFSLNLMFLEWATKGIKLWAVDKQTQVLAAADADYTAPAGTIAILDAWVIVDSRDLIVTGISRSVYAALTNKLQESDRPTQFYFDRQIIPIIYVWPVLRAGAAATLVYYRFRRVQTVTAAAETLDAPEIWLPAVVAGLTARFAAKWAPDRLVEKVALAKSTFDAAASEYMQRVKTKIVPDFSGYADP